jgi:anti-sigma B factor antagonist
MPLTIEEIAGVKIAIVPGEYLDASNAQQFKHEVQPLLETGASTVFDLRHLQFVDSSGIGVLLSCRKQVNAAGGDLKLCGVSKQVRVLFELVRLHHIFEIFNTREEAVLALERAKADAVEIRPFQEG